MTSSMGPPSRSACRSFVYLDRPTLGHRFLLVELEVQLEHIHPRLTEKAERPAFRVRRDDDAHLSLGDPAGLRYSRDLDHGRRHGDMRIKPARAPGHEIDRDRPLYAGRP